MLRYLRHLSKDTLETMEITVTAYARLHLGFLDLEGGLGRRFGCLGMAIGEPSTRLHLARASELSVEGTDAERARRHMLTLAKEFGSLPAYRLKIEEAIPAHAGLGSGTQLALAIGAAWSLFEGRELSPAALGALLNRGARSGIGAGVFATGGLVLDGGKGKDGDMPPIVAVLPVPEDWRIILLYDHAMQGVHGQKERKAFQQLPPFPAELAAHLCRLTVMQALPAVAEEDLGQFGAAIDAIQEAMGRHFANAQGGGHYASERVTGALGWLKAKGVKGLGQTSWGPTGFAFVQDATRSLELIDGLAKSGLAAGLDVKLTAARNQGAVITKTEEQPAKRGKKGGAEHIRGGN